MESPITKLESVVAGIRGYLSEQLSQLDGELQAARVEVAELTTQLASRHEAIEMLMASRQLLAAKLSELDEAVTESAAVPQTRAPRKAVQAPVATGTAPTEPVEAAEQKVADASEPAPPRELNARQREVLGYLEATSGVHTVAEIVEGVNGPGADNAAVQSVRRALAVLTEAGLAAKSVQSGTAFYGATAPTPQGPAAAKKTKSVKGTAKRAASKRSATRSAPIATVTAPADAPAPAPADAEVDAAAAAGAIVADSVVAAEEAAAPRKRTRKAVDTKATAQKPAPASASKRPAAKRRTAKESAATPADKSVRADRTKITALLQAAQEPQSAADVSRAVMGSEWKSSDATNFRNVLKSMVAAGIVTEHLGADNRARYTAAAGA
ncbi:hypothetical protein [Streptacidiphilus sp. EB129]|uniref:hypothetical protein n=1 Tax=Streptacidiphilus sp. EB129 TaxID=3156262 RepID=UPI003510E76A